MSDLSGAVGALGGKVVDLDARLRGAKPEETIVSKEAEEEKKNKAFDVRDFQRFVKGEEFAELALAKISSWAPFILEMRFALIVCLTLLI